MIPVGARSGEDTDCKSRAQRVCQRGRRDGVLTDTHARQDAQESREGDVYIFVCLQNIKHAKASGEDLSRVGVCLGECFERCPCRRAGFCQVGQNTQVTRSSRLRKLDIAAEKV